MSAAARIGLGVACLAGLVLASEGALSLALRRSWRDFLPRPAPAPAPPALELEREQAVAARATVGPYRVPEDPLVSYTLKLESELDYPTGKVSMRVRTDDLGLRARPRAADAPEPALRVVLLGDSVTFGIGVADDEILAARLEALLAAALPGVPVRCESVALPSWNGRNAWRFLLDHLERLAPDVVVYLPIDNDLEDGYGVNEAGERRAAADPSTPVPLLSVHAKWSGIQRRWEELEAAGKPQPSLGPEVLASGLGETSRWRLADLAATIARGRERLERAGARLALAFHESSDFQRELLAELARRGETVPHVPLLERVLSEDTLGVDPHPSAATTAAYARWLAEGLLELGWLPAGERAALPEVDARYADRRAPPFTGEEALEWSRARRAELERELEPRVSPLTLQGILQAHGGFNLDGSLSTCFAAVLPRGSRVAVELEPLAERPDLYPLDVAVLAEGRELGLVTVTGAGPTRAELELPAEARAAPFELRLEPRDWAVVRIRGRSTVAAARLVAVESLP